MRIHIIACRVLNRELNYFAALSEHAVEITWLPQGLHDTPELLRQMIKDSIASLYDQIEKGLIKQRPDVICLGYGLCSNGVVGVESKDIPIVIPRTDDCIALFLGSQKRYLDLFQTFNGAYWLNNGWIEACGTVVRQRETRQQRWQAYAEKYGEDNADYLIEQEGLWMVRYNACAFIHSNIYEPPAYPGMARALAEENGWAYKEVDGNFRMLKALTDGDWRDGEFLICPPYHRVEPDYTGRKVRAVKIDETQLRKEAK